MTRHKSGSITLYVNIAGGLCALGIGAYAVRSQFEEKGPLRCSSSYPPSLQVSLETPTGRPLSAIELQARAGAQERGVYENAKVVSEAGAPARNLLEVRLSGGADGGIRSEWTASGLASAHAACLAYSVWLPDGFAFDRPGLLPGLYGGRKPQVEGSDGERDGFATRIVWHEDGAGELVAQWPGPSDQRGVNAGGGFTLSRGRWMRIEQEVVLNAPGNADGELRLWVDGRIVAERGGVAFGTEQPLSLAGIAGDVGYTGRAVAGGIDALVRLSPFEISWK
jgi:hypothetical protein